MSKYYQNQFFQFGNNLVRLVWRNFTNITNKQTDKNKIEL